MEQQPAQGLWGRYALFVLLSLGLVLFNAYLIPRLFPPSPEQRGRERAVAKLEADRGAAAAKGPSPAAKAPDQPKAAAEVVEKKPPVAAPLAEPEQPQTWVTLGSIDPEHPYRMLVTLTNRGAAVQRIELNSPRFHDLEDRSGHLGHVVGDETTAVGPGVTVQVVGEGTPAALAGLVPETSGPVPQKDVIQAIDGKEVANGDALQTALKKTRPGQRVQLTVLRHRGGRQEKVELPVTLGRRPLEVVRPEVDAPPSFLMSLLSPEQIVNLQKEPGKDKPAEAAGKKNGVQAGQAEPDLDSARLRTTKWKIGSQDQDHVKFSRKVPEWDLEVFKTFSLVPVPAEDHGNSAYPAFHLTLDIEIRKTGKADRKVVYQLDGPNGLPAEGWWYASKVSREWSGIGLRDLIVSFNRETPTILSAAKVGQDTYGTNRRQDPMTYVGVDAQYVSAVLIPRREDPEEVWTLQWEPLYYGVFDNDRPTLTNTSFRVTSKVYDLTADRKDIQERFEVFAGPRKPELLAQYGLKEVVYYGWFNWAAIPLLWVLHSVYYLIPNYGVAIIVLTVLVRGAMFPLSRKQALGAQKMQEIQPELKRIQEKYKNDLEGRGKAQKELFRKHNYNPMGGCLIALLQLPVFVGLYRALMVDVELRQAPLISEKIRWASNLAAPDMLLDWSGFMPAFITQGTGLLGLGPYFNLLPVIAILLFLWQQKKFMPPPADEQAAMQQKMMQYMMIFMGILFFKVASGLCIYFIASSLWSISERKFLPKAATAGGTTPPPKPVRVAPARGPAGRDGSGPRKKKSPKK